MVRALLDGTKTQTRRTSTVSSLEITDKGIMRYVFTKATNGVLAGTSGVHESPMDDFAARFCPYGKIGDRLWVRETFRLFDSSVECACYEECRCSKWHGKPVYRATNEGADGSWKPSIFMPRAASRITLEITGIRVERLNDISETDAMAEGATSAMVRDYISPENCGNYRFYYQKLWESINGPGSWAMNPFVWVIEFRKVEL